MVNSAIDCSVFATEGGGGDPYAGVSFGEGAAGAPIRPGATGFEGAPPLAGVAGRLAAPGGMKG